MRDPIYTVGHSRQSAEAFLSLLQGHGIRLLADVRRIPKSSRHPHFALEPLAALLESHGITYRHFPALGGRRVASPDSVNTAWRVEAFRGYADYMRTDSFKVAVEALLAFAVPAGGLDRLDSGYLSQVVGQGRPRVSAALSKMRPSEAEPLDGLRRSLARTAVMCAEAVWWQCHRRLLADALLVQGVPVLHILSSAPPKPHELSEFAREASGELTYPGIL